MAKNVHMPTQDLAVSIRHMDPRIKGDASLAQIAHIIILSYVAIRSKIDVALMNIALFLI